MADSGPVLAAGAVLWRRDLQGAIEVALVHRPKYDDWSLPKGKADPGEHLTATACREVHEETGLTPVLTRRLPSQVYPVTVRETVRPKAVSWWLAHVATGPDHSPIAIDPPAAATGEIDEVVWLSPARAAERLTHDRDRVVLDAVRLAPLPTTTVLLARHASAGSRGSWPGPDQERPLDTAGTVQARWLVGLASSFGAREVVSADLVRCVDTVTPYARTIAASVVQEPALSEHSHDRDPGAALPILTSLARAGTASLVCSQGGVIPDVIAGMHAIGGLPQPPRACPKGSCWVLSFSDGTLVASDFHPTLDPESGSLPEGALVPARSGENRYTGTS